MKFKLRQYQEDAVMAGLTVLKTKKNGILVLPTGTGKSLVIAEIVRKVLKKDSQWKNSVLNYPYEKKM